MRWVGNSLCENITMLELLSSHLYSLPVSLLLLLLPGELRVFYHLLLGPRGLDQQGDIWLAGWHFGPTKDLLQPDAAAANDLQWAMETTNTPVTVDHRTGTELGQNEIGGILWHSVAFCPGSVPVLY